MVTALVSDLHLGTAAGTDVARRDDVRDRMLKALGDADRVVVLGDLLELREQPAAEVLDAAGGFLADLGQATAGRQLVICPGNHDHELVAPALDTTRIDHDGPLGLDHRFDAGASAGGLAGRVAALMPDTDVELAYPGLWLRDDVYATHGHYLDVHLTVPRVECIIAAAITRLTGDGAAGSMSTPEAYEAALAPLYAFAHAVVQTASPSRSITRGGSLSRSVWERSNPGSSRGAGGFALGELAIPAAVAAINRLGLGPFRADISAHELRRAGLRAMAEVATNLGIDAAHVIFGHTHRAGPLDGDVEGWWLRGGTRLTNTGSWIYEPVFAPKQDGRNPYWPGHVVYVRDEGPPELVGLLGDLDFPEIRAAIG